MTIHFLQYGLGDGYVDHWLAAGPVIKPASRASVAAIAEGSKDIPHLEVTEPVVDLGHLGEPQVDGRPLTWRYYRCKEDHRLDFSHFDPGWAILHSWAYTRLEIAAPQVVAFHWTASGPFDVWLDGQHLFRQVSQDGTGFYAVSQEAALEPGGHELILRFEQAGKQDIPHWVALYIEDPMAGSIAVTLPTAIEPDMLHKRQALETAVEAAYLKRYVYGYLEGDRYSQNEPVSLYFPEELDREGDLICRLQSLKGNIFQERAIPPTHTSPIPLAKTFPLWNGPHHLALLPPAEEYYIKKLAFERRELFYVARTPYNQKASRSVKERVKEALGDAAERRNGSLYCEIAKIALKSWEKVNPKILEAALDRVNQRAEGSVVDLLGLLGSVQRYGSRKNVLGKMKDRIYNAALQFRYFQDDPGDDAMGFDAESRLALFCTCAILAGQALGKETFSVSAEVGDKLRERGEAAILKWLRERGQYGFRMWDSPVEMEAILAALSHLVDLAESQALSELAAVLMDKIFFSLAVNSFRGAYGSSRGASDFASTISSRLEATSGVTRLMWGMGNFNEHFLGTVSLACCKGYDLPGTIRSIAKDNPPAMWSLERQVQPDGTSWEVNKATYRTADFMLSSVQDYCPGQPGKSEHVWQATLGPDAVVFTNHPTNMRADDVLQPNLWVGNGILPRAAQWGDVLIAVVQLPETDWLGFTHAYFPAPVFDEYALRDGWAFARVSDGYLALTSAHGFEFITRGQTAYRELRAQAATNIWVCHMGQRLLDGSFEDFQHKILAMDVNFDDLQITLKSLRGDTLEFGWTGPLRVNSQEQALSSFRHYENPYCVTDLPAAQMDIVYQGEGVRLKFD